MVKLEILVNIQSGQRQEFLQTFDMFCNQQVKNRACIGCKIFETIGTPNEFLWVEKWTDQKLMDDYMKTSRFKALLGAIQVLGELNNLTISVLKQLKDLSG